MTYDEISIIKQAIINEIEGYEFYRMAAKQTQSNNVQKAFLQLAEEEFMHVEWLKKFYSNISEGRDHSLHMAFVIEPPSPGLFNWDSIERQNISLAVSIYGISVHMEKASVDFYRQAAQKTQSPKLKHLYNTLIQWEKGHYEQFKNEYERLKEDYWSLQQIATS